MASSLYRVQRTALGGQLLDTLSAIRANFATLEFLREAIIQQKDGGGNTAADFATPAAVVGFVDGSNQYSGTVAVAAFAELDSFISNGGAALKQCAARFKQ